MPGQCAPVRDCSAARGAWLGLALALVACGGEADSGAVIDPKLIATSQLVPFTDTRALTLLAPGYACMVDSYEMAVVCARPEWEDPEVFGREGSGPGEYDGIMGLVPLPDGRLAVIGLGTQRITILSADREVERTIPLDPSEMAAPLRGARDSLFALTVIGLEQWFPQADSLRRRTRVLWFDADGDVTHEQGILLPDTVPVGGAPLTPGAWSDEHGFVFLRTPYELVRFSPDGEYLGRFTPAHYEPELPSERDVAKRFYDLSRMFGRPPSAADMEAYREKPKIGIRGIGSIMATPDGLYWVGTSRDRDQWSYIDVYRGGTEYLGSVRVRDRALTFDVRDSTLAVLVERAELDSTGMRPYAIDWYGLAEWLTEKGETR